MKTLIKALCLTLLFFAYTFGLLGTGMFLEKRILDTKEAEQAASQQEINVLENRTAEEYHRYYEIVVSRIKTSELEGINKDAIKEYIAGYQERFDKVADLFYPKRKETPEIYGSSFPMMFAELQKAFDENELNMYKGLILSTSMAVSNDDIELMFKDPMEDIAAPSATEPIQNQTGEDLPEQNTETRLDSQEASQNSDLQTSETNPVTE